MSAHILKGFFADSMNNFAPLCASAAIAEQQTILEEQGYHLAGQVC